MECGGWLGSVTLNDGERVIEEKTDSVILWVYCHQLR